MKLKDIMNQDPNGYISMAELDAIEAAQRGGPIGQIPGSFGSGQGSFQRSGGNRIDLTPQGWQDTKTNEVLAAPSNRPNQDVQLDYANPLNYDGAKGYRIKGDPTRAILHDGRMVDLIPGRQEAIQREQYAQQLARQKQEAAQLDMELKRQQLENAKGGEWHIDSASGMMINKRNGEIKPIQPQGGASQITPGSVEERLAASYGQRMALADQLLSQIGKEGYPTTGTDLAKSLPLIGDWAGRQAMNDKQQQYSQAQADWVRAKLRKESGAAIGSDEMAKEIETYFPKPGDTPAVIAQKAQARQIANEAMKMAAGKAGGSVTGVRPDGAQGGAPRVASDADYNALPKGATYIDPNGNQRTKR